MPSIRVLTLLLLAALCVCVPRPVAATAIANSTLSFSNLTISPAAGLAGNLWQLQAFASANNSLGESDAQFNFSFSPDTTGTSAAVTWATGSGAATALGDPPDLNVSGSASSSVNIPGTGGIVSAAFSEGFGNVSNIFTLSGSGTVAVQFAVDISGNLNVFTDGSGLNAFTQTVFTLAVDGGDPVLTGLFDQRALNIGRASSQTQSFSNEHLTRTVLLDAGVPHFLILQADSESSAQVPEPGASALLLVGLGALLWGGRRSRCGANRGGWTASDLRG